MKPDLVIFDCDGVIVDSEGLTNTLLSEDLSRRGLVLEPSQIHDLFVGGTISGVAKRAAELGADIPDGWVPEIYARIYDALGQGVALIPGVMDVMDRLDGAAIPYCVASNGRMAKMNITLRQHPALYDRLEGRIFSAEHVARPKPAPDLFEHAAHSLGHAPAACVVIEDSATGARGARAARMRCLGYAPFGVDTRLRDAGAELFDDMAILPRLLGL